MIRFGRKGKPSTEPIVANEPRNARESGLLRSAFDKSLGGIAEGNISAIRFGLKDYEQVLAESSTPGGITNPSIGTAPGEINDLNMGPSSGNIGCRTCRRGRMECSGHFGHIDFRNIGPENIVPGEDIKTNKGTRRVGLKFYHPLFMPDTIDTARIVCRTCKRIRVSLHDLVNKGLLNSSILSNECLNESARSQPPEEEIAEEEADEEEAEERELTEQEQVEEETLVGTQSFHPDEEEAEDDDEMSHIAASLAAESEGITNSESYIREAEGIDDNDEENTPGSQIKEPLIKISSHLHRMAEFISVSSDKSCIHCGAVQKEINFTESRKNYNIIFKKEKKKDAKEPVSTMSIHEIYDVFKGIDSKTCNILQIVDPKKFILEALVVMPPRLRPAYPRKAGEGKISNFITTLYLIIVQKRKKIHESNFKLEIWQGKEYDREFSKLRGEIQNAILSLMDNSKAVSKISSAPDSQMPTITQKFQKKAGLIRGGMNAKRVKDALRDTAIHIPGLDLDQVAISEESAAEIPKPVRVTTRKIQEEMQAEVNSGRVRWYIHRKDGIRKVVRNLPKLGSMPKIAGKNETGNYQVKIGDTIYRPLRTGDRVGHGRQPTIHKYSMMGYRIKIVKGLRGIGLALPITMYKNADFDGDQTTIHVPQSEEAEAELGTIMSPTNYIINAENNKVGIAQTFNALTAALHLTNRTQVVPDNVYNILRKYISDRYLERGEDKRMLDFDDRVLRYGLNPRSGHATFSMLLFPGFNYESSNATIFDGILIKGIITSLDVGQATNSITHRIAADVKLGVDKAVDFINDANHFLNIYIENVGFSMSLQDCYLAPAERVEGTSITAKTEEIKQRVKVERDIREAEITHLVGNEFGKLSADEQKRRRDLIADKVNVVNALGVRMINIDPRNPIATMIKSGAKGSSTNFTQIVAQVGQQYNRGQIMQGPDGYSGRVNSYYHPNDIGIESRGYITGSMSQGLKVREWMAHSWGARESIVDTPINTPLMGDIQRRMIKTSEGVIIAADGVVRNGDTGRIIQGRYADGFERSKVFPVEIGGRMVLSFIDIKLVVKQINIENGFF